MNTVTARHNAVVVLKNFFLLRPVNGEQLGKMFWTLALILFGFKIFVQLSTMLWINIPQIITGLNVYQLLNILSIIFMNMRDIYEMIIEVIFIMMIIDIYYGSLGRRISLRITLNFYYDCFVAEDQVCAFCSGRNIDFYSHLIRCRHSRRSPYICG